MDSRQEAKEQGHRPALDDAIQLLAENQERSGRILPSGSGGSGNPDRGVSQR